MPIAIFKVKDRSMEPAIKGGDYVVVNKLAYLLSKPKVKDIIVFKYPAKNIFLIKRITRVAKEKYFVTGDNKAMSIDSRKFGSVQFHSIVGKVISIVSV